MVRDYYATLLDVMQHAKSLGFDGRYDRLKPAIDDTFNLHFIAQAALSRAYWRNLDEAQKTKYTDAFSRLSIATYAARFDDYTGEKFKVLEVKETRRKDVLVLTQIVKSNGEPVPINYLLRQDKSDWRVIDVFLKGTISEVATRRSDFSSIMRDKGFDGLIFAIEDKIKKLKEE